MLLVTRSRGLFPPPPRRCRRRRPLVGHLFVVAEHLRVPHPGGGLRRRKTPLQRTGVATEGCHFCTVASFYPLFVKFCTRPCVTCCCHSMPPTQTAKKCWPTFPTSVRSFSPLNFPSSFLRRRRRRHRCSIAAPCCEGPETSEQLRGGTTREGEKTWATHTIEAGCERRHEYIAAVGLQGRAGGFPLSWQNNVPLVAQKQRRRRRLPLIGRGEQG